MNKSEGQGSSKWIIHSSFKWPVTWGKFHFLSNQRPNSLQKFQEINMNIFQFSFLVWSVGISGKRQTYSKKLQRFSGILSCKIVISPLFVSWKLSCKCSNNLCMLHLNSLFPLLFSLNVHNRTHHPPIPGKTRGSQPTALISIHDKNHLPF